MEFHPGLHIEQTEGAVGHKALIGGIIRLHMAVPIQRNGGNMLGVVFLHGGSRRIIILHRHRRVRLIEQRLIRFVIHLTVAHAVFAPEIERSHALVLRHTKGSKARNDGGLRLVLLGQFAEGRNFLDVGHQLDADLRQIIFEQLGIALMRRLIPAQHHREGQLFAVVFHKTVAVRVLTARRVQVFLRLVQIAGQLRGFDIARRALGNEARARSRSVGRAEGCAEGVVINGAGHGLADVFVVKGRLVVVEDQHRAVGRIADGLKRQVIAGGKI